MASTSFGRRRLNPARGLSLAFVTVYAITALIPVYSMVVLASSEDDTDLSGLGWPQGFLVQNATAVLENSEFMRYLINSLVVTSVVVMLDVAISAMAGYAMARLRYPGRRLFQIVIIMSLSLSPAVVVIPVYIAMAEIGWLDSYKALILPVAVSALGVFLVRQFALAIPGQLFNAARVDGASELRIFLFIALPLLRPALLTLALLQFLAQWDSLLWPLLAVSSAELWTLPLGLASFQGQYGYVYFLLMTGALISVIPPFILFLILQKYYVSGLTLGGVKR